MDNPYKQLGFKQPEFLENEYGIKIYIGTVGKNDWCVVIPKELIKLKYEAYEYDVDFFEYFVSERHALSVAAEYTELARRKGK